MTDDLCYVNDVCYELDVAKIDDLQEALVEAEEYRDLAREAQSIARSCERGWRDRIDAIQRTIDGRDEPL